MFIIVGKVFAGFKYDELELFRCETRADDHRAGRKEQTIAETLMSIRRGVAWRRWAELFSITSMGKWSLINST